MAAAASSSADWSSGLRLLAPWGGVAARRAVVPHPLVDARDGLGPLVGVEGKSEGEMELLLCLGVEGDRVDGRFCRVHAMVSVVMRSVCTASWWTGDRKFSSWPDNSKAL